MPPYNRATIYFGSGTGNSYRVASWFQEACQARGLPSELIPFNLAEPAKEVAPSPGQLVALAFPTHGLLPPWSVIKFIFRMPRRRGTRFLCLPTRGSFYIGRLLVPGAAGTASFLPALILLLKGYRPKGAVSFDMPVNMTSHHPPLTSRHAGRIVAAAKRKSERYFDRFFRRDSLWLTRNNLYELIWALVILYFIPFFLVLYLILGRFFMGKTLFAGYRCLGCGTCARSCSAGAVVMKGKESKRPYWRYNCEFCLRCLNFCPHHAVVSGLSWGVLLWGLCAFVAAGSLLYARLAGIVPQLQPFRNYWTVELLDTIFYYPVIIVAYFLFFQLILIKPLNMFFTWTSISHHIGQYREPGTSLKDLTQKKSLPIVSVDGQS